MRVVKAEHAGYCYGIKRAVDMAVKAAGGEPVVSLGGLANNSAALLELRLKGVGVADSVEDAQGTVIIRAHGAAPDVFRALYEKGANVLDATCPCVRRVQQLAKEASDAGRFVAIIGDESHPEIIATKGWAGESSVVIGSAEQAEALGRVADMLVVGQTTISPERMPKVVDALRKKADTIQVADFICKTTSQRRQEAAELSATADAVVVVGDSMSANSRGLYSTARDICPKTVMVLDEGGLDPDFFRGCESVAVLAGASAPESAITGVVKRLNEFSDYGATAPIEDCNSQRSVKGAGAATRRNTNMSEQDFTTNPAVNEGTQADAPEQDVVTRPEDTQAVSDNSAQEVMQEADLQQEELQEETSGEESFQTAFEKTLVSIRPGQVIVGTVVQITDDELCLNIGYKSDGIVLKSELRTDGDIRQMYKIGDKVEVEVMKVNDGEGNVLLSQRSLIVKKNWEKLVHSYETGEIVTGVGKDVVKGGLIVNVEGVRTFVPASQLSERYVEKIDQFIGQPVRLKIIEIDRQKRRLVASRKAVIAQEAEEKKNAAWVNIEEGKIIKGIVRRLTEFGAFVDLGGVDGLIHVTDLSWSRVKHPSDVVKPNQEVTVKILSADKEKERISLGLKQLKQKPWDTAVDKYVVGSIVEGKVVRIVTFGAFVELEPGLDGLVHISQVSPQHINKVEEVLSIGDQILVKVLEVNTETKRISLSIRDAYDYSNVDQEYEDAEEPKEDAEGGEE